MSTPIPFPRTREISFTEVEELSSALQGVSALLCPGLAIDANARDHVATLVQFLLRERERRLDHLREIVYAPDGYHQK